LCGMLSEMEAEGEMTTFLNIGIGINVNNDPTPVEPTAISLENLLNRQIERKTLLANFLDRFELHQHTAMADSVIDRWKIYNDTLGRTVTVKTINDTTTGMATDIDQDGALMLQLDDGSIKKIIYGDCFHL